MKDQRDQRQVFAGILLLGLGLIFLLANFGLASWIGWGRWWPLLLILIGLIIIFRRTEMEPSSPRPAAEGPGSEPVAGGVAAGSRRLPLAGLILVGLGVAFLLRDVLPGNVLPALILIAIGGALLLRQWSVR